MTKAEAEKYWKIDPDYDGKEIVTNPITAAEAKNAQAAMETR